MSPDTRQFAILVSASILAARKFAQLDAKGLNKPCPARKQQSQMRIAKAEKIMRRIERK
jgi:hypothetical protein